MQIYYTESDEAWIKETIEKHAIDMLIHIKQNDSDFRILQIAQASPRRDMREATDYEAKTTIGDLAVRIRTYNATTSGRRVYRDFTIRGKSANGGKTEIDKLRDGYGEWYLYGWRNEHDIPTEYILIGLRAVLRSGLYNVCDNRRFIANTDGTTGFYYLTIPELQRAGAIVANTVEARPTHTAAVAIAPTAAELALERKKQADIESLRRWGEAIQKW